MPCDNMKKLLNCSPAFAQPSHLLRPASKALSGQQTEREVFVFLNTAAAFQAAEFEII